MALAAEDASMTDNKTPSEEAAELRTQLEELRATDPAPRVAQAKQQVADGVSQAADSVSQAAANVAGSVSQTASNVADSVSSAAANVAETVAAPIRQGAERVRSTAAQVSAGTENLSERVRDQPFLALSLGVLTGYVIGRIVR